MLDITAAVQAGRAAAEERMRDTCRITKAGVGAPVLDPTTLKYTDPTPVIVYEGKCRIPRRATTLTSGASASAGEASWDVGEFPLDLPIVGSENVAVGHTVTYLTATDDTALVGQVFGITEPPRQSQSTARRFRMKQVVGGGS